MISFSKLYFAESAGLTVSNLLRLNTLEKSKKNQEIYESNCAVLCVVVFWQFWESFGQLSEVFVDSFR